jgi:predicted membrane-bound dolichyl-phosphate-mannose-protein mannosyltransferase
VRRRLGEKLRRLREKLRRLITHPRAPAIALALIVLWSLGTRVFYLGEPCSSPCRSDSSHGLIFDEAYYVNAARVIAGIRPPHGVSYADAPLHKDPNAEHPQLAKVIIAGTIELLGDNPWGWRIGSVSFGLIAIIALYALVRAAGGSPWLAVGAAGVMSLDNLALIHGRIATLDIYVLATVLIAAACYVRGWPLAGGIILGIAGSMKLIGFIVVPALVLFEAFRVVWARGGSPGMLRTLGFRLGPLLVMLVAAGVTLIVGIWLLDLLIPAYDPGTHITYAGDPFAHIGHMLSYAAKLKVVPDATGISSSPWQWLVDQKPIDYSRVAVNSLAGGKIVASRAVFAARGEINPYLLFLAIPALFAAVAAAWYERDRIAALGAAWCVGTFIPFVIQSVVFDRISYLYYMLLVLPGVYLVTARLFSPSRIPRAATLGWALALLYSFIDLYPVQSLSGH